MPEQQWTPDLVRSHAQFAVGVEMYTLPFYLTALASIKNTSSPIYTNFLSVCMEEMLHLELVANLCLAIGTTPNFTAPNYSNPIPLDPYDPETGDSGYIKATLGSLNQTTLNTMLDIETPEEFEEATSITPNFPYSSIGQMYRALWQGIKFVGWSNLYVGNTTNQQAIFGTANFSETISSFEQAHAAIHTISEQGEGKAMQPVPQPPFTMQQFPVPEKNQLINERLDPSPLYQYSHYGRFTDVKNYVDAHGFPDVYSGTSPSEQTSEQTTLQTDFKDFITNLNDVWAGNSNDSSLNFDLMGKLLQDAVACWQAGVIPVWS